MKERKETINMNIANIWSLVLLVVATIIGTAYYWQVSRAMGKEINVTNLFGSDDMRWWKPLAYTLVLIVVMIVGAAIHELVHGITWAHYCKNGWRSISFGVMWKFLAPYCHCSEPLLVSHYRIGALMPLYIVGILPLLVSPFVGSLALCFFGILFIAGAAGDLMVVWRLRKENPTSQVLDHPSEAGYYIYEE